MPHRRFSLNEVADYLHLSPEDVEGLVKEGGIPCERQGARLVFTRKEVDAWASRRIMKLPERRLETYHRKTTARLKKVAAGGAMIEELLRPEAIEPALDARTRASALKEMVRLAEQTGLVPYPRDLLEMLRQREEMCSTALPGGPALLHPRHHDPYMFADSFIAIGRTSAGIPFGAPDGGPTDLFFLICCQDDRIHLHVLARLCLVCTQTKLISRLREAGDAKGIEAAIMECEREVVGV